MITLKDCSGTNIYVLDVYIFKLKCMGLQEIRNFQRNNILKSLAEVTVL